MNQDTLESVPGSAPAEAASVPDETIFAEHLRLLDHTVGQSRQKLENQDKELLRLQAQVRSLDETFKSLRQRAAALDRPSRAREATQAVPRPPAPRLRLWPYAVLAAVSLALTPGISFQGGSPVSAQAIASTPPPPPPAPKRANEAIGLVLSYRPDGSSRYFAQLLGPELDIAGPSAWEAQSVGDGVFLVSFRPHDIAGPQTDYEFTVDLNARTVVPEAETAERLNTAAPAFAQR